jgi:hypothetical protein
VGILNAAVWCGAAIFLTVGLPAVFSPHLKQLLTDPGVGYAAEAIVARFFLLQYCCVNIALVHLAVETVYLNRAFPRLNLGLLIALAAVALAGGLWAQPRMTELHTTKYFGRTVEERTRAGQEFAMWHGASEAVNLLAIGGLILYLWRVSGPGEQARFGFFPKIRG